MNKTTKAIITLCIVAIVATGISYLNNIIESLAALLSLVITILIIVPAWAFNWMKMRKTYTIKKGKHRSGYFFAPILFKKKTKFRFKFDESALNTNSNDQINKLCGFSLGGVHKNSFRIGWKQGDVCVDLFAYYYINGIRFEEKITQCPINIWCQFEIKIENRTVKYFYEGGLLHEFEFSNKLPFYGFRNFPYFGGKLSSPHDISIELQIIY